MALSKLTLLKCTSSYFIVVKFINRMSTSRIRFKIHYFIVVPWFQAAQAENSKQKLEVWVGKEQAEAVIHHVLAHIIAIFFDRRLALAVVYDTISCHKSSACKQLLRVLDTAPPQKCR